MSDNDVRVRRDSAALASLRARIHSFEWALEIAASGWRYAATPISCLAFAAIGGRFNDVFTHHSAEANGRTPALRDRRSGRRRDDRSAAWLAAGLRYVLAHELGTRTVDLVGRDIGVMIAYAYAAQGPDEATELAMLIVPVSGAHVWDEALTKQDPQIGTSDSFSNATSPMLIGDHVSAFTGRQVSTPCWNSAASCSPPFSSVSVERSASSAARSLMSGPWGRVFLETRRKAVDPRPSASNWARKVARRR